MKVWFSSTSAFHQRSMHYPSLSSVCKQGTLQLASHLVAEVQHNESQKEEVLVPAGDETLRPRFASPRRICAWHVDRWYGLSTFENLVCAPRVREGISRVVIRKSKRHGNIFRGFLLRIYILRADMRCSFKDAFRATFVASCSRIARRAFSSSACCLLICCHIHVDAKT